MMRRNSNFLGLAFAADQSIALRRSQRCRRRGRSLVMPQPLFFPKARRWKLPAQPGRPWRRFSGKTASAPPRAVVGMPALARRRRERSSSGG